MEMCVYEHICIYIMSLFSFFSSLFSTVDTDEVPAKRPRLDCFIHQVKTSLYNAASLFGFPFQLTTKPMVTSACNGTRNVAPSGEVSRGRASLGLLVFVLSH